MKARHQPSDVVYEANDVTPELKPGPWECEDRSCALRLSHRRATISKEPDDEGKVRRSATFARYKGTEHALGCDYNLPEAQRKVAKDHPDVVRIEKNILYLDLDRSEPRAKSPGTEHPEDYSGRTTTRYGAVLAAARGIAKVIDRFAGDEEALTQFRIRHRGETYPWEEFSFGYSEPSLRLLDGASRLRDAEERRNRPDRPWFVRAIVERSNVTANGRKAQLRLISLDAANGKVDEASRTHVYVYAALETRAGATLRKLVAGAAIAVLASSDGRNPNVDAPWLEITEKRQLHVYANGAGKGSPTA